MREPVGGVGYDARVGALSLQMSLRICSNGFLIKDLGGLVPVRSFGVLDGEHAAYGLWVFLWNEC